jgi:adenylylsulfate kinase
MADGHIHPDFEQFLQRGDKERQLKQRAKVIWLTGLSGAGKTTVAVGLEQALHAAGHFTQVLDGDNIRSGINANLGFSEADRTENIRRIAEIAKLFLNSGIITICCFVSPGKAMRELARNIVGETDFIEVYINASLETCEQRDVKGLYAKARRGEINHFTGVTAPFEAPENPAIELRTDLQTPEASIAQLLQFIQPLITAPQA